MRQKGCSQPHHMEQQWEWQPVTIWALFLLQMDWEQTPWAPADAASPSSMGSGRELLLYLGTGWEQADKSLCHQTCGCAGAGSVSVCATEPMAWCCLLQPCCYCKWSRSSCCRFIDCPMLASCRSKCQLNTPPKRSRTSQEFRSVSRDRKSRISGTWCSFCTSRMQMFNLLAWKRSIQHRQGPGKDPPRQAELLGAGLIGGIDVSPLGPNTLSQKTSCFSPISAAERQGWGSVDPLWFRQQLLM